MNRSELESWIEAGSPDSSIGSCMFCLPFAGGGASTYRKLQRDLARNIHVLPIRLPGRESRIREPARTELRTLIPDLARVVSGWPAEEVILFGYSMGALIAFELARALEVLGKSIAHLIVAAAPVPHLPRRSALLHTLDDEGLIQRLRGFGGTPHAVLNDKEFMRVMLPTVRADFALLERYRYTPGTVVRCSVLAIHGSDDTEVDLREASAWRYLTSGRFELLTVPGDHFFIHEPPDAMLRSVRALAPSPFESPRC
jgi:surfactin synthase thioesterase subunit